MDDAALIVFIAVYGIFITWLSYESSPAYRTKQRRRRFFPAFARIIDSTKDDAQQFRELKLWFYHASSLNPSWLRDVRDLSTLLSDIFFYVKTYGFQKAKKDFGVDLGDDHAKAALVFFHKLEEEQPFKTVPPPFGQHLETARRALTEGNVGLGTDALNHIAVSVSRLFAEAGRSKRYFYITLAVSALSVAVSVVLRFL